LIRELNVEDDIKIVGHIPKLDQISLLKQSSAVIQPTLFEGGPGGGAAYDAIALGKPLIVSDIPVNLEIEKDDRVFFFRSKDVGDLVLKMQEASQFVFNAVDNDALRDKGKRRKLACGRVLLGVINEAAAK
jgi:glycosyltransferase involved in cell wall biosynthesis